MGEDMVVQVVEQSSWWMQALNLMGPAAAAVAVLVLLLRPFLKTQAEQVAKSPTRDDLAAGFAAQDASYTKTMEAESEKTRITMDGLTKSMDRVADGLQQHNGDMSRATKEINLLPYRMSLTVGRAVHSQKYVARLEAYYGKVEQLRQDIDMSSDPEQTKVWQRKLDTMLEHPPGRED